MEVFFKSNSKRREILLPLLRWRYLGLKEIKEASGYVGSRRGLAKFLTRLEKDGLVDGFLHFYANRKFYNLTKGSWRNYSDKPWSLNPNIKNHDSIVSSFLFELNNLPFVTDAFLNFPSGSFGEDKELRQAEPDGYFTALVNNREANFALEIELNRKSRSVFESKLEAFYQSITIDGVFYIFNDLSVLEAYYRFHEEFRHKNEIDKSRVKVGFCFSDELGSAGLSIPSIKRINSEGDISTFGEVFL